MSSDIVAALIAAFSGFVGVLFGERQASRRWRAEMKATSERLEIEAQEKRRDEARKEVSERRATTRDDYTAILTFLLRLDRCVTQCNLMMDEAARSRLVTSEVADMTRTVVGQLSQLGEDADHELAMERGATDVIRSGLVTIKHQLHELQLELSLAFGFADVEPGEELSTNARTRAAWFEDEVEKLRGSVRRELNVG